MITGIIDEYVIFSRRLFASGLIANTVPLSAMISDYGIMLPNMSRQDASLINYFETGKMAWFDYGAVKSDENIALLLRPDGLHTFGFNEGVLSRFKFSFGKGAVYVVSDIKEPGQSLRALLAEISENPYNDQRSMVERIKLAIHALEYRSMLTPGTLQLTTVKHLLKLLDVSKLKDIPDLPMQLCKPLNATASPKR